MGKRILHIALLACLVMASGCNDATQDQIKKWRVSLRNDDKLPYGTYLSFQSLQKFFPEAKVEALSSSYRFTSMNNDMHYSTGKQNLMILVGLDFRLSDYEWVELKRFVQNGNELIIFCSRLDDKIETQLNQSKGVGREEYPYNPKNDENVNSLKIQPDLIKTYGYRGRDLQGYFSTIDTATPAVDSVDSTDSENDSYNSTEDFYGPDTLGTTNGKPDIIRYSFGAGHITLHAAPLVLSNYFLLQRDNINYLSSLWNMFPNEVEHVYWINYYVRSSDESSFDILWRYPATKWALMLTILLVVTYVLFQMKRRQREIPIIAPLRNDSVTFVETVGRLYFNKGNHANLSEKMIQQFLEWVRNHYYLNTNLLNDDFIKQLTMKSGVSETTVKGLVEMIHEIRTSRIGVDDAYLYQLHTTIQIFYKNHSR